MKPRGSALAPRQLPNNDCGRLNVRRLMSPPDLGRALFLFHNNDIPDYITSKIRMFADDTIRHCSIKTEMDKKIVQKDLSHLEQSWSMSLHPQKCSVLCVMRRRRKQSTSFTAIPSRTLTDSKCLGITISSDNKWNSHINNTIQSQQDSKFSPAKHQNTQQEND